MRDIFSVAEKQAPAPTLSNPQKKKEAQVSSVAPGAIKIGYESQEMKEIKQDIVFVKNELNAVKS